MSAADSEATSDARWLQSALAELQATASNFAHSSIKDARVRVQYVQDTAAASNEIMQAIQSGKLTARQGAETATAMRNHIMELSRLRSSPIGRAYANQLKRRGKTFAELAEKYAQSVYRATFASLDEAKQSKVFAEMVSASGRPNDEVIKQAKKVGRVGHRLVLVSIAVAVYEIYQAEDKPREVVRQTVLAGAGVAGGWMAGSAAVATGMCAATAPLCVGVAALAGGILLAAGADLGFGSIYAAFR